MSTLRKQMEADMAIRALAYRTREAYVGSVAKLAQHYRRSPDRISEAQVQRYLLYLLEERKLAHSSVNIACSGLEFFYRVTMKRREAEFCLPRPKVPSKLPQILSREEVAALFEHTTNQKHRAFLMTTYAAGLRLSEACHLKVSDIDSDRMTIRVEQGKGAKDRYTPLSPRLLGELRRYWASYRPKLWLFPGMRDVQGPLLPKSAQRIFYAAKERAGITKRCGIHGLRHAFATHSLEGGLHVHCLVAAGALHSDGHWIGARRGFLFPVHALSQVFRGKFLAALTQAFGAGDIELSRAHSIAEKQPLLTRSMARTKLLFASTTARCWKANLAPALDGSSMSGASCTKQSCLKTGPELRLVSL